MSKQAYNAEASTPLNEGLYRFISPPQLIWEYRFTIEGFETRARFESSSKTFTVNHLIPWNELIREIRMVDWQKYHRIPGNMPGNAELIQIIEQFIQEQITEGAYTEEKHE